MTDEELRAWFNAVPLGATPLGGLSSDLPWDELVSLLCKPETNPDQEVFLLKALMKVTCLRKDADLIHDKKGEQPA